MVLLKLVGEVVEIAKRGVKAYFTQMRGSSALDNVTSLSFNLLYLVGFIFRRLGPLNPAYYQVDDVCHGFAALVGWMTMFFFLLGPTPYPKPDPDPILDTTPVPGYAFHLPQTYVKRNVGCPV